MLRRLVLSALSLTAPLALATSQTPGSVVGGRVAVRIFVSLADSVTRYSPVASFRLFFYRSATDSAIAITDSTGSVTAFLAPGDYRLVSAKPIEWRGSDYTWNAPILVRPGMSIIDLRGPDAPTSQPGVVRATRTSTSLVARATDVAPAGGEQFSAYYRSALSPKDPSTAFLWSFFFPGAGQMYAGETGKGVGLFVVSTVGGIAFLGALASDVVCTANTTAYGPGCGGSNDQGAVAAVGGIMFLGSWIYSMADAGSAARRWNERHGLSTASVAPIVQETPRGRSFGVSFTLQR